MPLRNRVTPFSGIEATAARGLFMGQRGMLHDGCRELVSQTWKHKAWVTCRLEFRGRRRTVMAPRRYTELFFLDEAVALAAGHRPCAECRRADYTAFVTAWSRASRQPARAPLIDAALHLQRVAIIGGARRPAPVETLPDGTFVCDRAGHTAYLKRGRLLLEWSHFGYAGALDWEHGNEFDVLTPAATIAVLRAGFEPVYHPSAARFGQ